MRRNCDLPTSGQTFEGRKPIAGWVNGSFEAQLESLWALHDLNHLVMTNSLPWKDPPFLIGKPSISMGHFPWLC